MRLCCYKEAHDRDLKFSNGRQNAHFFLAVAIVELCVSPSYDDLRCQIFYRDMKIALTTLAVPFLLRLNRRFLGEKAFNPKLKALYEQVLL